MRFEKANSFRRPITVLIIAPALEHLVGGQAVQAARLCEGLNAEECTQAEIQSIAPVVFPRLQKVKYLRTVLTSLIYLVQIAYKIPRFDLIHVFSAANVGFLLFPTPAVLYAKLWRKTVVLNYRSGQLEGHFKGWGWLLRPVLRLVDVIVTPSNYLVDVFMVHEIDARCIYNIIEPDRFQYRRRDDPRPIFLSNRLLEKLYNIQCVIKAFRIIQDRFPESRLYIAAGGDQRPVLERLVKELRLEYVNFVGEISQEEMKALYNEVDVYLNSPNTDNMPGSLLECYASGLPIVSTNAGGIPYIVDAGKTALLVEINDHEAMASAAIRVLTEPGLAAAMGENGRKYVKRFSWHEVGKDWLDLYCELLGGSTSLPQRSPTGRDSPTSE